MIKSTKVPLKYLENLVPLRPSLFASNESLSFCRAITGTLRCSKLSLLVYYRKVGQQSLTYYQRNFPNNCKYLFHALLIVWKKGKKILQ